MGVVEVLVLTRIPVAWNTASNACVRLASRSCRTNFARALASPRVHQQVAGLLDDPGLDRVLRGAQDPDAPVAVRRRPTDPDLPMRARSILAVTEWVSCQLMQPLLLTCHCGGDHLSTTAVKEGSGG
jgi:hypothetical protein